jgi:AcrR family transcriptional regulator
VPVEAALAFARQHPEIGQFRASRELRIRGVQLSPSGVRAIWKRHGLETSYHRLLAKQRETGTDDAVLTEAQRARLQRARVSRRVLASAGADADSLSDVRRGQLLSAAARVFSRRGYDGASLREICAAAGILPGSLYYHFKSKEDLFVTVHAEGFREINAAVDRALDWRTDPWERLEAACAAHLAELVSGNEVAVVTGTSLFQPARPALQRRLNRERDAYEDRFRGLIDPLPLPPDVDRTLLRLTLLGALNWTRIWYRPGRKTPAAIAHHLVTTLLRR